MSDEKAWYTTDLTYPLHQKEKQLLQLIREMQYGVIKELKIQHGLPEVAEVPMKRIRFGEEK